MQKKSEHGTPIMKFHAVNCEFNINNSLFWYNIIKDKIIYMSMKYIYKKHYSQRFRHLSMAGI